MCNPNGIGCYERSAPTSDETCLKACEGIYSAVDVDTSNRTLALNGRLKNNAFRTFLEEYLLFKRAYEIEFDDFYEEILPEIQEKDTDDATTVSKFVKGWPFLNEQAVLQSFTSTDSSGDFTLISTSNEVEQRLEIVEIYFKAPTFDEVVKDARTNFVTKISMLGGTLGLFTGFSILSGIEIIYFSILLVVRMYQR